MRGIYQHLDLILFFTVCALILFGLAEVSSVSAYESFKLSSQKLGLDCGIESTINCNNFYLKRQFFHVIIAFIALFVVFLFPLSFWHKMAPLFFFIGLCLLFLLFTKYGITLKGATGWLDIPGLPSIQPVEIVKITLILYLARWLEKRQEVVRSLEEGFLPYSFIVGLVVVLLALQPDFGAILVIVPSVFAMYFLAGARLTHLIVSFIIISFVALFLLSNVDHIKKRWEAFINPEVDKEQLGSRWQVQQSLIAVGSGGLWGVGISQSTQRFGFLPEVQSDTIFAAISEELGFVRVIFFILGGYILFTWRGLRIAGNSGSRFGFLVAAGITIMITLQVIINIMVTIHLLPLTGITLPFMSYGGSSLIISAAAVGILLRISQKNTPQTQILSSIMNKKRKRVSSKKYR
jgi:cell division protein FtsW